MENTKEKGDCISLLSLPESILDNILSRLSPIELIRMSEVCTTLMDRCRSDDLWDNHIKQKWGRVIGDVAYKEWQWHLTAAKEEGSLLYQMINQNGSLGTFSGAWPMLCLGSYLRDSKHILSGSLSNNFMMALYISLENGKFWFPAQVYRGLLVSSALVCYDSKTDTFQARQQMGGRRFIGNNIEWQKLRAPPVETSPCVRHMSDCLDELKPGDHIEIQWKSSSEDPYDWWYAVIGHLDSCNENKNCCRCQDSETLIAEFKQYPHGSSMRRAKLFRNNRWDRDADPWGIYGGIRKLHTEEEIERWKQLLPYHQPPFPAAYEFLGQLPLPAGLPQV